MAKSIGIDLGTTNSVVGIKKINLEMIQNAEGELLTPSCVTLKKKKKLLGFGTSETYIVGRDALEWRKQDPSNTITAVKRLMGRNLDDPEIQKIIADRNWRYGIAAHSKGTIHSLAVILGAKEHTPEQISAKILEKLKRDTEKALADTVEFAVITVPAYFNDKQKHATRTAASLAGLKVRRLLPEPTAAAISFGVDAIGKDEAKTVLVFDFGGGTFDLSVLTISGGQFIEQGKGGDMWLGGEDIDGKIMDFVLAETAREFAIDDMDALIASQDEKTRNLLWGELKSAAEQAKIRLSDAPEAHIEMLALLKDRDGDRIDIDVALTRQRFEELIAPVIDATVSLIRKLLADIHFSPDLIDNVLLVGGSCKIPAVIAAIEKEFGKEKVWLHERPMLAIAEGAAILSHRLSDTYECPQCGASVSQGDTTCGQCGYDLESHLISEGVFDIVHAAAHDYYIHLENNDRHLFIEKNTPLPCEKTELFQLVHSDQRLVHMKFFNIVNDMEESIGDLWLGIDEKETESNEPVHVEITLKIDENNLVEVAAGLKELPEVAVSKTLSRGKADEKLFLLLEDLIHSANQKGYDTYKVDDLTHHALMVIQDIGRVIDPQTDDVNEEAYRRVEMKIDKTAKLAEADIETYPLIYYAENMLIGLGHVIPEKTRSAIQEKIDHLKQIDAHGTYAETVQAIKALNAEVDAAGWVNTLMMIKKAGELCETHEPARVAKFYNAIDDILRAYHQGNAEQVTSKITEIMPEAREIVKRYDLETGIIHKDIKR